MLKCSTRRCQSRPSRGKRDSKGRALFGFARRVDAAPIQWFMESGADNKEAIRIVGPTSAGIWSCLDLPLKPLPSKPLWSATVCETRGSCKESEPGYQTSVHPPKPDTHRG